VPNGYHYKTAFHAIVSNGNFAYGTSFPLNRSKEVNYTFSVSSPIKQITVEFPNLGVSKTHEFQDII